MIFVRSMSSALQNAIEQVYLLNVGIVGTGAERHERPHKPLLLLAVLEMLDDGLVLPSRVEWSTELRHWFAAKFDIVRGANDEATPENPFFFLRSDGFWEPIVLSRDGAERPLERKPAVRDCDQARVFARFSKPWDALLADTKSREIIRDALISRYFPAHRAALLPRSQRPEVDESVTPIRSAAFRRALLDLYDHQCSACGLRVRLPEIEFTLVDAAHLVPFSVTRDDRPANGICLCKNHHWAMDQRLLAPTPDYTWIVSRRLDARRSRGE